MGLLLFIFETSIGDPWPAKLSYGRTDFLFLSIFMGFSPLSDEGSIYSTSLDLSVKFSLDIPVDSLLKRIP
jgi:hypothetical protein